MAGLDSDVSAEDLQVDHDVDRRARPSESPGRPRPPRLGCMVASPSDVDVDSLAAARACCLVFSPTPTPPSRCLRRPGRSCRRGPGRGCGRSRTWASSLPSDYGEGVQHVGRVLPVEAVEVEVEGVEPRPQVAALLIVPYEGRAIVSQVPGEGLHVVGRVRQPEHVVADDLAGGRVAETPVVVLGRNDGKLL